MQILSKFYIDSVSYTNILIHFVSMDYQRWRQGDIQLRAAVCNYYMQYSVIIGGYQKPPKQTLKQFKIGIPLSWILSMPPLAHKSYGYI